MGYSTKSQDLKEQQPSQTEPNRDTKICTNDKGGWISSLLILGTSLGLNIALGAWYSNLMVFLIQEFNVKNIHAAQINNVINGLINFFPFIASIVADFTFGPFPIVLLCSIVSLMGLIMLTLIVTIQSLRPTPCALNSTICVSPSSFHYSFLYIALTLASLGQGGARFLLGPMGADQFDEPKRQESFFNWFTFNISLGWIIGYTVLVYLQDSVSWVLAYGFGFVANVVAIVLFLSGSRIYQRIPSQGSPFTSLARVFVASIRKMGMKKQVDGEDCYFYESLETKVSYGSPSKIIRFLNQAALIKNYNIQEQSTTTKSWSLCTVEEVEDLKKLIKIIPLWSSCILLSTPTGVIMTLTVLMALVMDRNIIGPHFKIPAATFYVISIIVSAITTPLLDRFLYPAYKKLTGRSLTHIQCIGVGHVSNILAMSTFALIEQTRLSLVHLGDKPGSMAPLSALWLVFPLAIRGVGVAFYFPKETTLFYKEFPNKLRSISSAMMSLQFAIGYYLSSAFLDLVGRMTSWLPNDIDHGRVDKVYWVLVVVASLNFGYFLLCAMLYKYNNNPEPE